MAVPSVSELPARILPSLDVPLPSNQDKEVVNVKGAVMENTLQPEELSEAVVMTIPQLLVFLVFFFPHLLFERLCCLADL